MFVLHRTTTFKPEQLFLWFLSVKKDSQSQYMKIVTCISFQMVLLTRCDLLERGRSALLHALRHFHDGLTPLSCCASSQVFLKRQLITEYQAPVLKECLHFFFF